MSEQLWQRCPCRCHAADYDPAPDPTHTCVPDCQHSLGDDVDACGQWREDGRGLVPVDEASFVERAALTMYELVQRAQGCYPNWAALPSVERGYWREDARSLLSVLIGADSEAV